MVRVSFDGVAVASPSALSNKTTSTTPAALRTGAVIAGRYLLLRQLGSGGMGEVWLARHCNLRVKVALKFLVLEPNADAALVKHARDLFRREAQLTAQLCALTPHVVRVHDAGVDAARYFLVMEYVHGRSLGDVLRKGPVSLDVVVTVLEQVAAALDVAHGNGVVHRDVKPGNILLTKGLDGSLEAKLADFGVAQVMGEGLHVDRPLRTSAGGLVGTPEYMSPEQLLDAELDGRSDVWALGVVAYEALTGISPFRSLSDATLPRMMPEEPLASVPSMFPGLPRTLDDWFDRALQRKRDLRFASAGDCARALRECLDGEAPTARLEMATGALSERDASLPGLSSSHREIPAYDPGAPDLTKTPVLRIENRRRRARFESISIGLAAICGALLAVGAVSFPLGSDHSGAALPAAPPSTHSSPRLVRGGWCENHSTEGITLSPPARTPPSIGRVITFADAAETDAPGSSAAADPSEKVPAPEQAVLRPFR